MLYANKIEISKLYQCYTTRLLHRAIYQSCKNACSLYLKV